MSAIAAGAAATVTTSAPALVAKYQQLGFRLLYWERKGTDPKNWKGPRSAGWNSCDRVYDLEKYDPAIHNLGTFTGFEVSPGKFLADVDLDWPEAIGFTRKLLPPTGFGFGRKGKKISHAIFTTDRPADLDVYADIADEGDGDGITFLELRGGIVTDNTFPRMTMIPRSLHSEGVYVELAMDEEIAYVYLDVLKSGCIDVAIASILYKRTPGGLHHDGRLALAGFLLRHGFSAQRVVDIGQEVLRKQVENFAPDMSAKDVADMELVVSTTAERIAKGKKAAGGPKLAEFIGERGKAVVARIAKWIGADAGDDVIVMRGGDLSQIVDRAQAALLAKEVPIYTRGGVLVRPIRSVAVAGEPTPGSIRRDANSVMLTAVREPWLLEEMGKVLQWRRIRKDGEGARSDPETKYARTLLGRGEWAFPELRGIVTAPTLDRNGRIIERDGFDAESGLLVALNAAFPPIPSNPTKEDAQVALERLLRPMRQFPFVDEAAKSVAVSAMVTALVRQSLRTAPLHGFDAPAAGTGKSLLAELVGLLAHGYRPAALSQGKTAEEDEKRLGAVLLAGDSVIHIDNCDHPISGDFLCSMLSQEVVQMRPLGHSEMRKLPATALVLASGNNLTFAGDVSRRVVVCRLDAKCERPEHRTFDFDCHAEVLADRPALVVAGLTILRAYHVAGRPVRLTPMGSFNDWEWMRGALVWLGCADPADTRTSILDNDPKKDELLTVMELWEAAFGAAPVEVREIEKRKDDAPVAPLHDLLIDAACRGGAWSAKSVGWWLKRNKDRVLRDRCFRSEDTGQRQRWQLIGAGPRAVPDDEQQRQLVEFENYGRDVDAN